LKSLGSETVPYGVPAPTTVVLDTELPILTTQCTKMKLVYQT